MKKKKLRRPKPPRNPFVAILFTGLFRSKSEKSESEKAEKKDALNRKAKHKKKPEEPNDK